MASTSTPIRAKPKGAEEFQVRIGMAAKPEVTNELLEDLTICAQDALSGRAAEKIAPGASASANFTDRMIEIDFIVAAKSIEDLHRRVGEVAQIAFEAIAKYEPDSPVSFASSATSSVLTYA